MSDATYKKKRKGDYTLIELWDEKKLYFKVGSLLFVLGGLFWQFSAMAKTVDKHEAAIPAMKTEIVRVNQKLDDIMDFYHIPRKEHPNELIKP